MRTWILAAIIIVGGLGVIIGVSAALANDNTGKAVSSDQWAHDVCGVIGAWKGQLEAIRDEINESNYAGRRNDGGSGDSVERTIIVRVAIDRAIQATQTLREGLKRAGIPDTARGQLTALKVRSQAFDIERRLRTAKALVERNPDATEAYTALAGAALILQGNFSSGPTVLLPSPGYCPALREDDA